jgi:hypothetical protein
VIGGGRRFLPVLPHCYALGNKARYVGRRFMRPNPYHFPAEPIKAPIGISITGTIGLDLRSPEFGVFLGPSGV